MLSISHPRLLTIRREGDHYQVNLSNGVRSAWRDDPGCRECLHSLLARNGWKRIRPADERDPLTGDYRRYAH